MIKYVRTWNDEIIEHKRKKIKDTHLGKLPTINDLHPLHVRELKRQSSVWSRIFRS